MAGFTTETNPCQEYFGKEHNLFRNAIREFVKKEITPNINEWEEACEFPRELYDKMAALGFLGVGYPEEWGGTSGDIFLKIVYTEEMMHSGSGGLVAGIGSFEMMNEVISKIIL